MEFSLDNFTNLLRIFSYIQYYHAWGAVVGVHVDIAVTTQTVYLASPPTASYLSNHNSGAYVLFGILTAVPTVK